MQHESNFKRTLILFHCAYVNIMEHELKFQHTLILIYFLDAFQANGIWAHAVLPICPSTADLTHISDFSKVST